MITTLPKCVAYETIKIPNKIVRSLKGKYIPECLVFK